jgi:hypothetical protein
MGVITVMGIAGYLHMAENTKVNEMEEKILKIVTTVNEMYVGQYVPSTITVNNSIIAAGISMKTPWGGSMTSNMEGGSIINLNIPGIPKGACVKTVQRLTKLGSHGTAINGDYGARDDISKCIDPSNHLVTYFRRMI